MVSEMKIVVTFKAEILVEVDSGLYAEEKAREHLIVHPEVLKCITLSCERTKIKRLEKEQRGMDS